MTDHNTYPVARQFSVGFNPVEDRLVLVTELKEKGSTTLLLTRRMVLLILKQVMDQLPGLTGLDQTPARYWQEVLQLTHRQAMEQHRQEAASARGKPETAPETEAADAAPTEESAAPERAGEDSSPTTRTFLGTELTCQQSKGRLQLAFKGLPMPEDMLTNGTQSPVLALSLEATHVHQVLQLLITHATKADWHLPVNLPWIQTGTGHSSARVASH